MIIAACAKIQPSKLEDAETDLKQNEYDKAIADSNKVIELDSKDLDEYEIRAKAYFYKREYDKAWDDVKRIKTSGGIIESEFLKC